ncbi:MAG: DUF4831 family protein [Bacteroidales bacterium]|nr:DUF4831 family protein [Bacteroidales bacterium]
MLKIKTVLVFITAILLFSCKTEEQNLNVINVEKVQGIRNYSTLYALPKTVIRVNVEICQTISKEGPFSKYAKSLLNIDNAIKKDDIKWNIEDIKFTTYPIPDTNNIYIIEHTGGLGNFGISLTRTGLICSVNIQNRNKQQDFVGNMDKRKAGTLNFNPEEEKLNTTQMIDFNDVPLLKEVNAKKSTYERARVLAEKIYTLRDDRAAIIVGDGYTENMPDGIAMKEIIKELNKLEQKYISMFVGKQIKRTYKYSFDFVPETPKKTTQAILFRFSEDRGVVSINDVSGMPVIIEIESQQTVEKIIAMNKRQNYLRRTGKYNETSKGLFYRIPELVSLRLIANDNILAEKNIMLPQFGDVHALSPQYLTGKYSIEYYPELGSIKKIELIK